MDFHTPLSKRLKFDPGLVVVMLLTVFATWPLLRRPGLPTFTDADHHVYRTLEIILAWQQGVPYLHWAPDFYLGQGYPVFNYYSPLTYYLGAAYGWFFGGATAGVKFVLVGAAGLGMLGMYWLVRGQWGDIPGVVGAAAYGLSPYLIYVDPQARGAVPETLAIALAPWLWWTFSRLLVTASPGYAALAAVIVATLILAHNLMSFVFIGLVVVWLGGEFLARLTHNVSGAQPSSEIALWRAMPMAGAALALGVSLAAFMWLPAWLERNAVQFSNAFVTPSYGLHFVGAGELFGPASLKDVIEERQSTKFRLGVAQWALGALGMATILGKRTRQTMTVYFAVMAAGCIFLILPASVLVWSWPTPLVNLQLPWRLLGVVAVAVGVLAGAATNWTKAWPRGQAVFAMIAVAACLAAALPLLDPWPWTDVGPADLKRFFVLEQSGVWGIGTTQQGEFLPVEVKSSPDPQATEALLRSYDAGLVDKVDRSDLPEGAEVVVLAHGPISDLFLVTSRVNFVLRVFTFYFPGWTAYIDDVATSIQVHEPEGWIALPVPAGTHEVLLRLEDTWPRRLGWIISGLAGVALLGFAFWRGQSRVSGFRPEPARWRVSLVFIGITLAGLGARYAADRNHWWTAATVIREAPGEHRQHFARLENNVALLAFDLPQTQAKPGEDVPVTLDWQAVAPVSSNLSVFVHLLGPDGQLWGQSDEMNPSDFPTSRWPVNHLMRDAHVATLRPDAPPGVYTVRAGLWDRYTGLRMRVLDGNGAVTDQDGVALTSTFVVQP